MRSTTMIVGALAASADAFAMNAGGANVMQSQRAVISHQRASSPTAVFGFLEKKEVKPKKGGPLSGLRGKVVPKGRAKQPEEDKAFELPSVPALSDLPLPGAAKQLVALGVLGINFGLPVVIIAFIAFPGVFPGSQTPFNFLDGFYPPRVAEMKAIKAKQDKIAADAKAKADAEKAAADKKAAEEKAAADAEAAKAAKPAAAKPAAKAPPPPAPKPPPPPPAPKPAAPKPVAKKEAAKPAAPKPVAKKKAAPTAAKSVLPKPGALQPAKPTGEPKPKPPKMDKLTKTKEEAKLAAKAKAEELYAKQMANVEAAREARLAAEAQAKAEKQAAFELSNKRIAERKAAAEEAANARVAEAASKAAKARAGAAAAAPSV